MSRIVLQPQAVRLHGKQSPAVKMIIRGTTATHRRSAAGLSTGPHRPADPHKQRNRQKQKTTRRRARRRKLRPRGLRFSHYNPHNLLRPPWPNVQRSSPVRFRPCSGTTGRDPTALGNANSVGGASSRPTRVRSLRAAGTDLNAPEFNFPKYDKRVKGFAGRRARG